MILIKGVEMRVYTNQNERKNQWERSNRWVYANEKDGVKGKKRGEFIQMVVYKVQGAHYHAIGLTEIGHTTIIIVISKMFIL